MMMRCVMLVLLAWSAVVRADAPTQARARELTLAFYESRIDEVWSSMSPRMQAALGRREDLAAFRRRVQAELGGETGIIDETFSRQGDVTVYLRRARFDKSATPVLVQWAFGDGGAVEGFHVRPDPAAVSMPAPSSYLDYRTKTRLRLPFEHTFFVFWGGRSVQENAHAAHANQRFALDLVVVHDAMTHAENASTNEDYYCFGVELLAPADGIVVEVVDGIEDNVPGVMNAKALTGNRVILDHGNREYSMLAHLRRGSIGVKRGQRVRAGEVLGQCGNSGNSSEPHLHYQLQDGPVFGEAAGLPAQFTDYEADGEPVARGEPVKGQRIRPLGPPRGAGMSMHLPARSWRRALEPVAQQIR